jgi:hypothetical protein
MADTSAGDASAAGTGQVFRFAPDDARRAVQRAGTHQVILFGAAAGVGAGLALWTRSGPWGAPDVVAWVVCGVVFLWLLVGQARRAHRTWRSRVDSYRLVLGPEDARLEQDGQPPVRLRRDEVLLINETSAGLTLFRKHDGLGVITIPTALTGYATVRLALSSWMPIGTHRPRLRLRGGTPGRQPLSLPASLWAALKGPSFRWQRRIILFVILPSLGLLLGMRVHAALHHVDVYVAEDERSSAGRADDDAGLVATIETPYAQAKNPILTAAELRQLRWDLFWNESFPPFFEMLTIVAPDLAVGRRRTSRVVVDYVFTKTSDGWRVARSRRPPEGGPRER